MKLIIVVLTLAQSMKPLPTIQVTGSEDVKIVNSVNRALSTLTEKVTACVSSGKKAESCQCSYPNELEHLRTAYATLIHRHPEWKDQLLSYPLPDDPQGRHVSGTLVLPNLRRQLETLKCK